MGVPMQSFALDLITPAFAAQAMGATKLHPRDANQEAFQHLLTKHGHQIAQLRGLEALVSPDYQPLNELLRKHGFNETFGPGIDLGVVSILDMLVEWLHQATKTTIDEPLGGGAFKQYPAFEVPEDGVQLYRVGANAEPLVRLLCKNGDSVWLVIPGLTPASGLQLALTAQAMAEMAHTEYQGDYAGAVVPMLEMDLEPDLGWLNGLGITSPEYGTRSIDEAAQQYKLRMNEQGARVKVATTFVFESCVIEPEPYRLDRPFIGWFTQAGHDELAIAPFYAAQDSWKSSGESLEDL